MQRLQRVGEISVTISRVIAAIAASSLALIPASALAQRQPASPEQRLDRLERQVQQVQRQVFPKGRPADTAGFTDEPAATQSSVVTLDQRLGALERQMADILRQSEENGNRLHTLEADLAKAKSDQEQRIATLEQRMTETAATVPAAPPPVATEAAPLKTPIAKPKPDAAVTNASLTTTATADTDPGEQAYSDGFHLWEAGQFDQAIASLKAFTAAYPKHRRVSYANNLIGRALLDQGKARDAAAVFLANYRANSRGDRAADSLYYLGQAEVKLGQPSQACKAYAELDAVYGSKVRADLRKQVDQAKTAAQCS
jgi:TolA-binding protein